MQIETTTITTENTQVLGANFQITTFEMKTEVICDICGERETDTPERLKNDNWYLGTREEFCGECNC